MATHSSILAWRIPMDRRAWRTTVHGVAKSWAQLSKLAQHSTAPRQPQALLVGSCSLLSETFRPRLAKAPHYYTHITVRETALQYSSKLTLSLLHKWVLPPHLPECNKCLCLVSSLPQMASMHLSLTSLYVPMGKSMPAKYFTAPPNIRVLFSSETNSKGGGGLLILINKVFKRSYPKYLGLIIIPYH